MVKILTYGEVIWDVYGKEHTLGGAGLNFAAHCQRCGAHSSLISGVGNDALGELAIKKIKELGVDLRFVKSNGYPTGRCDVTLNSQGVPSYSLKKNTAYDFIELTESDLEDIKHGTFDAICFGTLIQRSERSRLELEKLLSECSFKSVVCDVNLRVGCYDERSLRTCLENATILKVSDEEEPLIRELGLYTAEEKTPEAITLAICEKYPKIECVLYTMGERGAYVYVKGCKAGFLKEAKKTEVVSTVGAGDSFTAAFVTSYLSGFGAEKSLRLATELSGFVVSKKDAIPKYCIKDGQIYE